LCAAGRVSKRGRRRKAWPVKRPRLRRDRTAIGEGVQTQVQVGQVPELGDRVRLIHLTPPKGQFVFDYPPEGAMELGRYLIAAGREGIKLRRELEREAAAAGDV
jgi:hypothetical protein